MAMKVEKQSSKLIKPSVSTHQTNRHYRIGLVDELVPSCYVPIVLFFPPNDKINQNFTVDLRKSLEKTLTQFYPLAGRYIDDTKTVECNDEGVEFIRAKVNIKLQNFLDSEFNHNLVNEFIPFKTHNTDTDPFNNPLLTIQVTTFECGGVAVGVSASHTIVDASSLCTFLTEWASVNREKNHVTKFTGPVFTSPILFPSRGLLPAKSTITFSDYNTLNKFTNKKLSFRESEISNIRMKVTASGKFSNCKLSKVQLVSAILWKALRHVDQGPNDFPRESVLTQPIDLRGKMGSVIPKHACGNLWLVSCTRSGNHEKTTEELVDLLTSSVNKTLSDLLKVSHDSKEGQELVLNSILNVRNIDFKSLNIVMLSSWCKFPFYETDFGFGKPIWATNGFRLEKNTAVLMDDAGGNGVEAYIGLDKQDVHLFEEALDIFRHF